MTHAGPSRTAASARRDVAGLAIGLLAFTVMAFVAWTGPPGAFERDIFWAGNDVPNSMHVPIEAVMQGGTIAAVFVVAAITFATRRVRTALSVLVAGMIAWLVVPVFKHVIVRQRPAHVLHGVVLRGHHAGGYGFPSGHTAVAFAVATTLAPDVPRRIRPCVWLLAAIVGFARVYVGAHFPLDVLGGAALGYAIGSGVRLAFRNLAG